MMRLTLVAVILIVVIGAVAAVVGMRHYEAFEASPVLEEGEAVMLEIPAGTSWPEIVQRVEAAEIVETGLLFDIWGRRSGLAEEVRAGSFYLQGPMELDELAAILRRGGRAEEVVVTFPEGLTIFEIAHRVEEAGLGEAEEFLRLAREPSAYDWIPDRAESLEGYLYPDTYHFRTSATPRHVVERLLTRWQAVSQELLDEYPEAFRELEESYEFDLHDLLTMASIVERESGVGSERSLISRVFYNRLDRGMQLQTDPTCVYGPDTYHLRPTRELCRDPLNRYSTYVIQGLPPGPIANPGRDALRAALVPSDTPEAMQYLYFVARRDGTGEHYFSTNYADHRRAIDRYLR